MAPIAAPVTVDASICCAAASFPASPIECEAQLRQSWSSCIKISKGLFGPGMTATEGPVGIWAQLTRNNRAVTQIPAPKTRC